MDGDNLLSNIGTNNSTFLLGELNGRSTITGNPFFYDPADGNLLMTVIVTGNEPACDLESNGDPTCSSQGLMWRAAADTGTSRAWFEPDLVPYGFPLSGADDVGLVTNFTYTQVPEPSGLVLLGTGILTTLLIQRRPHE